MKDFNWTEFTRKIAVRSTGPIIYDAWTKASEIEKWFLRNADYLVSVHRVRSLNYRGF